MSETVHAAVMTREILEELRPRSGGRYVDGTLGGATHTEELLRASAPDGRVLSFDLDREALSRATARLAPYGDRWIGVEANFRRLGTIAPSRGFQGCDGVLLDLGFSSDELHDPTKGLSFLLNGPLDMRLGPSANEDGLTAADIVNTWSREEIEDVLRTDGEERYARRIADAIVAARKMRRLLVTHDLASVIQSAVPRSYEHGRIHPATRTFQALRIAVNDELGALRDAIDGARSILAPGGTLAIISFHSLEDRVVKHAFRHAGDLEVVTKRPRIPTEEEIHHNPRARSAKLRVARKCDPSHTQTTYKKQKYVPHVRPDNDAPS